MTNKDKLTAWHKPTYDSKADDDCIVCLTEKQIYLVGQALTQMAWDTRWLEGIPENISSVIGELEFRLADKMPCEQLTQLVSDVEIIQVQVDNIQSLVYQNNTGQTNQPFVYNQTTINDVMPLSEQKADIFGSALETNPCDKDAIYGACIALVNFMNQNNIDFLERVAQGANASDQAERLIDVLPVAALLPVDEIVSYTGFLVEELLDEYNATVDQSLLDATICDLFCIATNNGRCSLDFSDVLNYFRGKLPSGIDGFASTLLDVIVYATAGNFIGDEYFYFMNFFQLWTLYIGWRFMFTSSLDRLAIEVRRGLLAPDNSWVALCVACPDIAYKIVHDFSAGLGDWALVEGTVESFGIKGEDIGQQYRLIVELDLVPDFNWRAFELHYERIDGIGNGGFDTWRIEGLLDTVLQQQFDGGFDPNLEINRCEELVVVETCDQVRIILSVADSFPTSEIRLYDVVVWLDDAHPSAELVLEPNICP